MRGQASFERILRHVQKPGRYLGGEWNERKKDPSHVQTKVALIFPDVYEIGMSYLGQKILYSILNDQPEILAERAFAPWPDLELELRSSNFPLFSLENKIPLYQFDILGFSLLYELNYSNILTILDLGRIPLLSAERGSQYPLIIAGGPAAFNPEPTADIFDLFLLGDGEEAFLEIIAKFNALKRQSGKKDEILEDLAKIKGVYVPSLYKTFTQGESSLLAVTPVKDAPARIQKRIVTSFGSAPFPEDIIVPNVQVIFDRVAMEVARGCPQKCRFCQATSLYFPYRTREPAFIMEKILKSLRSTGYEDVSLSALSLIDYPVLENLIACLMKELSKEKVALSLSSLRPKGLTPDVAQNIIRVRKTGLTLVPEAGTERLRRIINKNLDDQEILDAAASAFSKGWRLLKLYFMIGLPTEGEDDLEGIGRLVQEIISLGTKTMGFTPRINLSLSSFIPKPHTPFQWLAMEEEDILLEKKRFVRSRLRKCLSVKIKDHPTKMSILECTFSRGDRRLGAGLLAAWKMGARFEGWKDYFHFDLWEKAFQSEGINYRTYLGVISPNAVLPWDHIHTGLERSHLLQEMGKAFEGERTPSCLERECGECLGCEEKIRGHALNSEIENMSPDFSSSNFWKAAPLGKKTEQLVRYLVVFSKLDKARFLSHLDLMNILRRSFRRGGVEVAHSEGFHPKMLMSFLSALPLGMEGRAECFEFKSRYLFEEQAFLERLNHKMPSGIKFLKLVRIDEPASSLNERVKAMIYGVDLSEQEIRDAVKKFGDMHLIQKLRTYPQVSAADIFEVVEGRVKEFQAAAGSSLLRYVFNEKEKKLLLYFQHNPRKAVRPQDAVEKIFGIENSAFLLSRERIIFEGEANEFSN